MNCLAVIKPDKNLPTKWKNGGGSWPEAKMGAIPLLIDVVKDTDLVAPAARCLAASSVLKIIKWQASGCMKLRYWHVFYII